MGSALVAPASVPPSPSPGTGSPSSAASPTKAGSPPTIAWNRISTLGCDTSPANAGATRTSEAIPLSMNMARLPATLPVPAGGIRGATACMTAPT